MIENRFITGQSTMGSFLSTEETTDETVDEVFFPENTLLLETKWRDERFDDYYDLDLFEGHIFSIFDYPWKLPDSIMHSDIDTWF